MHHFYKSLVSPDNLAVKFTIYTIKVLMSVSFSITVVSFVLF